MQWHESWMAGSEEKHEDRGAHWLLLTAGDVLKKQNKADKSGQPTVNSRHALKVTNEKLKPPKAAGICMKTSSLVFYLMYLGAML